MSLFPLLLHFYFKKHLLTLTNKGSSPLLLRSWWDQTTKQWDEAVGQSSVSPPPPSLLSSGKKGCNWLCGNRLLSPSDLELLLQTAKCIPGTALLKVALRRAE